MKETENKTILNIDETFQTDPRFDLLSEMDLRSSKKILMFGSILNLWMTGFLYWKKGADVIPLEIGNHIPNIDQLVQAKFAERRENGFYIKGSKERWAWYRELITAASRGGASRSEKKIQAARENLKKANSSRIKDLAPKRLPSYLRTFAKPSSSSSSSTSLNTKNPNTEIIANPDDFSPNEFSLSSPPGDSSPKKKNKISITSLLAIRQDLHHDAHQADPLGGPMVNGILAGIVKEIGILDAEKVLRWFYRSPVQIYHTSAHDVKLMRRDLSKLITEARKEAPIIPNGQIENFNRAAKQLSNDEEFKRVLDHRRQQERKNP